MSEAAQDFNFLTPDERQQMRRFLMFPEEFPREFKDWLLQYVGVNASLQRFQVDGLQQYVANFDEVIPEGFSSGTSYDDLDGSGGYGPELTGLGDGQYLLLFGAHCKNTDPSAGYMSLSYNGSTPSDDDAVVSIQNDTPDREWSLGRARFVTLENGGNNVITVKYRHTTNVVFFAGRWLTALRIN